MSLLLAVSAFRYFPTFTFTAVLPLPNRSYAAPIARRDVGPVDAVGRARRIEDLRRHQRVVGTTDAGVGIAGEDVVVAYAALKRQPVPRLLILRVERRRHEVALTNFDGRAGSRLAVCVS